jgi:hypothetical protein
LRGPSRAVTPPKPHSGLRCRRKGVDGEDLGRDKHPGTPFTITYRETATFPLSLGRAHYGNYPNGADHTAGSMADMPIYCPGRGPSAIGHTTARGSIAWITERITHITKAHIPCITRAHVAHHVHHTAAALEDITSLWPTLRGRIACITERITGIEQPDRLFAHRSQVAPSACTILRHDHPPVSAP